MGFQEDIVRDLQRATKEKDMARVFVLRGLKTVIKNKQVELGQEPDDNQIYSLVASQIKKARKL